LSKQDARSFHRPPLQFHANVECRFSKSRTAKKKKDKSGRTIGKGGDATQAIRFTSDLSLRESTNFVLWEYSVRPGNILVKICLMISHALQEEHPPILSNFGMGSMIVNYYRKKTDHDDHVPKVSRLHQPLSRHLKNFQADYGEAFVLEPSDDSPFMRFGYVYQGQTVPTMYNNLIRAPLFRHKAYSTDFLVIRSAKCRI
jgi:transcription initiation factor TFIID subunit 1, fungi type